MRICLYTAGVTRTRWGDQSPSDGEQARALILDAAETCFARRGLGKTTVEDVAAAAKVSRATVYRYFRSGRDELVLGVVSREAERFLDRLVEHLEDEPTFGEQLVEAVLFTLQSVRLHPKLELLFAPDVAGYTGGIAGASATLYSLTQARFRPVFEAAAGRGELRADVDIDDAIEWFLRIVMMMLSIPGRKRRSQSQLRSYLADFLLPALTPDSELVAPRPTIS